MLKMLLATDGEKLARHKGLYQIESMMRFNEYEWRGIGVRDHGFNKADCNDGCPTEYYIYYKYNPKEDPNVKGIVNDLGPYFYDCSLLAFYIEKTEYEVLVNLPKFVLACDGVPHPTEIMEFLEWNYDEYNIWNSYT